MKRKAYELLNKILQDVYQIDVIYWTYPYDNLERIDHGLRKMIWNRYETVAIEDLMQLDKLPMLYVIKSNLGFYNLLILFSKEDHPEFISVGPFLDEDVTPDFLQEISVVAKITPSRLQAIRQHYEGIPKATLHTVCNLTLDVLSAFFDEFKNVLPQVIQYGDQQNEIMVNYDILQDYSTEFLERYQSLLLDFLGSIKKGELETSQEALKQLLYHVHFSKIQNLSNMRNMLHVLNNYCHCAILSTNVHPNYNIQLAFNLSNKISSTSSITKLKYLPYDICHKYCLLIRNYDRPEYSKLTRDITNYVQLHLEEELTLSSLAERFHRNASSLSNQFRKETGMNLTKFIHSSRTQEAIRLFNTTDLSISDVAVSVGFQDFAYFSKVFKKETGCTPREYKNGAMH